MVFWFRRSVSVAVVGVLILALFSTVSMAESTRVTVRVLSKGAKFVGSSMGGVRVTLEDAQTGEILAEGQTAGSTGSTGRIMREAHTRPLVYSTEDAAQYTAELDLVAPRKIRVTAYGPLAQPQAANEVSATQWVLPGKHITGGDAFLLELPGFVVDVLNPPAHVKLDGTPQTLKVQANITMMCGCPIQPGGLWNANDFQLQVRVERGEDSAGEFRLLYAGTPSQFERDIRLAEPGVYKIIVYAFDPGSGNTGLDWTTVVVNP